MGRDTRTGGVMEAMIFPALRQGGYSWRTQVKIGRRPGGGRHIVDAVVTKDAVLILLSSKWQEVSGTAEAKCAWEVICLIAAMKSREYKRAYLILGGPGWTYNADGKADERPLRDFYVNGGLEPYIRGTENVRIVTLERFVALANQSEL